LTKESSIALLKDRMVNKKTNSEIKAIPRSASEDQKTNLTLIIFSVLFLITLGVIIYLFLNLRKTPSKIPPYPKKQGLETQDLPNENPNQDSQISGSVQLTNYKSEAYEFSVDYPVQWGKVLSEKNDNGTTFKLGPESKFTLTAGYYPASEDANTPSAKKMTEELAQKGCDKKEVDIGSYRQGYRVACDKAENPSEQGFIQDGPSIYAFSYEYDPVKTASSEAADTFDLIFNSFRLL